MDEVEVTFMVYDGNREAAVEPFIEIEFHDMQYIGKQIEVADYHICKKAKGSPPSVVAALERKTLPDFAAGFKDGRYGNLEKMLSLRDRTGCQLYFIIEGPAFPSLNRKFARIPYSRILDAITYFHIRHGIMVILTEDQAHTAKRLHDLALAIAATKDVYKYPIMNNIEKKAITGASDEKAQKGFADEISIPAEIMERIELSDDQLVIRMWSRLRGISVVLGSILLRQFCVADLVQQSVSIETIRGLKTATGRPIHKDACQNLLAIRAGQPDACAKLLSGIKGITLTGAATMIKAAGGFPRLCSYSVPVLSMVSIPQKNRNVKLGNPKAERIHKLLRHSRIKTDISIDIGTDVKPLPEKKAPLPQPVTRLASVYLIAAGHHSAALASPISVVVAPLIKADTAPLIKAVTAPPVRTASTPRHPAPAPRFLSRSSTMSDMDVYDD